MTTAYYLKRKGFFSLLQGLVKKKTESVPDEIQEHIKRLQTIIPKGRNSPVLQVNSINTLYAEASKILPDDLFKQLMQVQDFESRGIVSYGSFSDILRKLALMLYGGVYSDLDGMQLALLTPSPLYLFPHTFKTDTYFNDPYIADNSAPLWKAILREIITRYHAVAKVGILPSKKTRFHDGVYTGFLTGGLLVSTQNGNERFSYIALDKSGFLRRFEKKSGIAKSEPNLQKTYSLQELFDAKKMELCQQTREAFSLKRLEGKNVEGVLYISQHLPFKRAVMSAGTWFGKKKKENCLVPDDCPF